MITAKEEPIEGLRKIRRWSTIGRPG